MACRSRTGEQYLPPSCSLGFPLGTERKRSSPTMLRRERSNVHSCWAHFLSDGRRLPPPATDRTSSSRWLAFLHPVALKSCINIKIELSETITLEFFFFCTRKGHHPSWSANIVPNLFCFSEISKDSKTDTYL